MKKAFGYFDFMPYSISHENFEDYRKLKNKIPKEKVIEHIESLEPGHTSLPGRRCIPVCTMMATLFFPLIFCIITKTTTSESLMIMKHI